MFNKSALLIIIGAAFAVALPVDSASKGSSTLDGVRVFGVSIPSISDVNTPSTDQLGITDVHEEIREVAHLSFHLPEVEEEKAPTVPKDALSELVARLPRDEPLVTDELPKVDASSASVLKNPDVELPNVLRSFMPSLPRKGKNKSDKEDSDMPDASTLRPPSGAAAISWNYARAQPNDTVPQPNNPTPEAPDVSDMHSAVGDARKVAVVTGNLPRERHIPGVYMPSDPSTTERTQSSPPTDLKSFGTNAAKGLESPSSSNVKSPSLARRAESCSSDYTLTYCRQVLQSDNTFIPELLQTVHVDSTSVTGPVGLSCSPAKTTDYVYPLCSKKMDVVGLALDCVEAIISVVG
ncbi:hypothetical protein EDD22DRAFT_972820 [Suillus occidentalis]|nr:hypothetical protein EDD22DRAFT_972820 [Suillus occidentalis]